MKVSHLSDEDERTGYDPPVFGHRASRILFIAVNKGHVKQLCEFVAENLVWLALRLEEP